ncbi:hypothetical protein QBC45DRAFT_428866 [Copromyces sp. CBS 386.78]|nr:hypothetical protein QBC45DRAFT_428866 [Copromyces sp. CBS 386.78]
MYHLRLSQGLVYASASVTSTLPAVVVPGLALVKRFEGEYVPSDTENKTSLARIDEQTKTNKVNAQKDIFVHDTDLQHNPPKASLEDGGEAKPETEHLSTTFSSPSSADAPGSPRLKTNEAIRPTPLVTGSGLLPYRPVKPSSRQTTP